MNTTSSNTPTPPESPGDAAERRARERLAEAWARARSGGGR
ncbi:hypothetical protein [Embleya sp. NPDC059237]